MLAVVVAAKALSIGTLLTIRGSGCHSGVGCKHKLLLFFDGMPRQQAARRAFPPQCACGRFLLQPQVSGGPNPAIANSRMQTSRPPPISFPSLTHAHTRTLLLSTAKHLSSSPVRPLRCLLRACATCSTADPLRTCGCDFCRMYDTTDVGGRFSCRLWCSACRVMVDVSQTVVCPKFSVALGLRLGSVRCQGCMNLWLRMVAFSVGISYSILARLSPN